MVRANADMGLIDFESRSACSLKSCGAWVYSLHPTTEILCACYRLPHWPSGVTALWTPVFPQLALPENVDVPSLLELFDWIDAGLPLEAHNAFFERAIWQNILAPRHGFPLVPENSWRCSAAKAASHALPRKLEDAGAALRLTVLKDIEGAKVMKKLSKPRKPRKKERESWVATHGTAPMPLLWWEDLALFQKLWAYCRQDVLAEESLSHALPDLSPQETQYYCLDQRMNQRGFQLDMEGVRAALSLIAAETTLLNGELTTLTDGAVTKATQRDKMKAWLLTQGLTMYDTKGATIDDILAQDDANAVDEDLPPFVETLSAPARRALEILRTLGRSSTAKYETMLDWAGPDGRVRGGLLYHGASTGRWSGAGVQPHNFPKGTIKGFDMEEAWGLIKAGDRAAVMAKYPSVMETLACALRGAIVAGEGKQLYVADYASIEARVLLWLAREEGALQIFRDGGDIYCDMAASIYARPITKDDKHERQLGKAAVLGCFGAGTPVLTNRGWVGIDAIRATDSLWDGRAWVRHDGVLAQGLQGTLAWNNIRVTPDHKIWTGMNWRTVEFLVRPENAPYLRLALDSVTLPWWASRKGSAAVSERSTSGANVVLSAPLTSTICVRGAHPDATCARNESPQQHGRTNGGTLASYRTLNTVVGFWTGLVQCISGVTIRALKSTPITAGGVSVLSGRTRRKVAALSSRISSLYRAGTSRFWKSTASTTMETTQPAISVSLLAASSCTTDVPVFDILNAGPQHRFTIWTSAGPLIVSNCGYQMGASKFVGTAALYGATIDDEFATQVVDAYRSKYHRVKQLWWDTEDAAKEAVSRKGHVIKQDRLSWQRLGNYLYCTLPSGRRLAYPEPELRERATPWGAVKMALTFKGINTFNRQWERQTTYGGSLVENVVQAVSRDLMAAALQRLEESGTYVPLLSIHDETVCEAAVGTGDLKEYEGLLTELPRWAAGCPIGAESWWGPRYRKG